MGQLKECKSRNGCYEHLELCYIVSRNKENIHGVRTAVACLRKKKTPLFNFFIMNVGVLIDK